MVIKNAFGRLKGRWRYLLKRNDIAMEDIPTIINACCILHNICEVHRDEFNDAWLEESPETHQVTSALSYSVPVHASLNSATAEAIRSAIRDRIVPS
jgi:hypothetical protein